MAIRSGFFNSMNGDRKYDASKFAEYFASFIGNGVFPDSLEVISNNNMTVTVKSGRAWINGYIMVNDDNYVLNINAADGVLNRIDRIVLRYDVVDREIRLEVKQGEFASTAITPELKRDNDAYELCLADITVSAGTVSITDDKITDTRLNTELCGKVDTLIAGNFLSLSEDVENLKEDALEKTGDGKDVIVTFTEAATEAHITSGEKLSIMFGKILKMFKGKAPNSHASSDTTYGVGTTSNYGHCKTINGLTQSSHADGTALSAYQGKVLNDLIPSVVTGSVALTDTISGTTELTKTIPIGAGKKNARFFIQKPVSDNEKAGIVLVSNLTHVTGITLLSNGSESTVFAKHSDIGSPAYLINNHINIFGVDTVRVSDVYISGSNLFVKIKNTSTSSKTLNTTIAWEAW